MRWAEPLQRVHELGSWYFMYEALVQAGATEHPDWIGSLLWPEPVSGGRGK